MIWLIIFIHSMYTPDLLSTKYSKIPQAIMVPNPFLMSLGVSPLKYPINPSYS
jgi:hypothetical protein